MASNEETCEGNANFAIICSFITKFGDDCGVHVTIPSLKQMLEDTKNVPDELKEILIHLLRKGKKRVTKERWERAIVKFCHEYSSIDAWEIERFGYKKAKIAIKLELLKRLLELQFDYNAKFKTEVNKHEASTLRVLPIGRDIDGHMYWYQLDKDCNMRLYKQDSDDDSWQLLCSILIQVKSDTGTYAQEKCHTGIQGIQYSGLKEIMSRSNKEKTREELQGVIGSLGKKTSIKKDVSKVLKYEPLLDSIVPTDAEKEPKKESKENLTGEHEDLKASLSPTNPCAIIIKTEKKEASLIASEKNIEKSNQSMDSLCSKPKPDISVIENRTLNIGISSKETSENLSPIKISLKRNNESLQTDNTSVLRPPDIKMEVDNSPAQMLTSEDNSTCNTGSTAASKLAIKGSDQSHVKASNESTPMEICSKIESDIKLNKDNFSDDPLKNLKAMSSKLLETRTLPMQVPITNDSGLNSDFPSTRTKMENPSVLLSDVRETILDLSEPSVHHKVATEGETECRAKGSKMKLYEKWSNEKKKQAAAQVVTNVICEKAFILQESNFEAEVIAESKIQKTPIFESEMKNLPCDRPVKPTCLALDVKGGVQHTSVISPNRGSLLLKTSPIDEVPQDLSRPFICHTSTSTCVNQSTLVNNTKNSKESISDYVLPKDQGENAVHIIPQKKAIPNLEQLSPVNSKVISSSEHALSRPFKKKHLLMAEGSQCTKDSIEPCRHSVICEVKNSKLISPKLEEPPCCDPIAASCVVKSASCKDLNLPKQICNSSMLYKDTDFTETNPQNISRSANSASLSLPVTNPEDKTLTTKKQSVMTDYSVASLIADNKPKPVLESTSTNESQGENTSNVPETEQPSVIKPVKNEINVALTIPTNAYKTKCLDEVKIKETSKSDSKHALKSNCNFKPRKLNFESVMNDNESICNNLKSSEPVLSLKESFKSDITHSKKNIGTDVQLSALEGLTCESTKFDVKPDSKSLHACKEAISDAGHCINDTPILIMQKPVTENKDLSAIRDTAVIQQHVNSSSTSNSIENSNVLDLKKTESSVGISDRSVAKQDKSIPLLSKTSDMVKNGETTILSSIPKSSDIQSPFKEKANIKSAFDMNSEPIDLEVKKKLPETNKQLQPVEIKKLEFQSSSNEEKKTPSQSKKGDIHITSIETEKIIHPIDSNDSLISIKLSKPEKSVKNEKKDVTSYNTVLDCSSDSKIGNKSLVVVEPHNVIPEEKKENLNAVTKDDPDVDISKVNSISTSSEASKILESCDNSVMKPCKVKQTIQSKKKIETLFTSSNESDTTCPDPITKDSSISLQKDSSAPNKTEKSVLPSDLRKDKINNDAIAKHVSPLPHSDDVQLPLPPPEESEKATSTEVKISSTFVDKVEDSFESSQEKKLIEGKTSCDLTQSANSNAALHDIASGVKDSAIIESEKNFSVVKNTSPCKTMSLSNNVNEKVDSTIHDYSGCPKKETVSEKDCEKVKETKKLNDDLRLTCKVVDDAQKKTTVLELHTLEKEVLCADKTDITESNIMKLETVPEDCLDNASKQPISKEEKQDYANSQSAFTSSKPTTFTPSVATEKTITELSNSEGSISSVKNIAELVVANEPENQSKKKIAQSMKDDSIKTDSKKAVHDFPLNKEQKSIPKVENSETLKEIFEIAPSVEEVKIAKPDVFAEDSLIKSEASSESAKESSSLDQEMSDNPPDLTPNINLNETKTKNFAGITLAMKADLKDNSESSDISNDIPILDKQISDTSTDDSKMLRKDLSNCRTVSKKDTKSISIASKLVSESEKSLEEKDISGHEGSSQLRLKDQPLDKIPDLQNTDDGSKTLDSVIVSSDAKKDFSEENTIKSKELDDKPSETSIKEFNKTSENSSIQEKDYKSSKGAISNTCSQGKKRKRGRKSIASSNQSKAKSLEVIPIISENTSVCDENQSKITSFKMDFFDDHTENIDLKNFPFNAIKGLELHQTILAPKPTPIRNKYGSEDPEEILKNVCKLYTSNMRSHCCETKYRSYISNYGNNNFAFKVKNYHRLGLELPVLKSEPVENPQIIPSDCRTTRGRNKARNAEPKPSTPIRKPRAVATKAKVQGPKSAETTPGKNTPDFIPEGFLEILGSNKAKGKPSEKEPVVTPARGRRGRAPKVITVPSSESESTSQSLPIKRSRRIQEQHEKKMSELAVEMQKEHRRLEQLAKKNTSSQNRKSTTPAKDKPAKPAAKTPVSKFQPPEAEDACLEAKRPKRNRKTVMNMAKLALMYDDESKDSEQSTSRSTEKSRRRRCARGKKRGFKPWDVSSESETSIEEVTEEDEEEEVEEPLVFTINDDEFACEEVEEDAEPVVVRRARTAKKDEGGDGDIVLDDKPCGKCGKHDRPEWILLCDNCDDGYHTSCLVPPLFNIPDGDWYCQPCEHLLLCECLTRELQKLDQLLKQKEREELRKQRLAYVGISLDNVLKPEKKETESSSSEATSAEVVAKEKKVRTHKVKHHESSGDEKKKLFGKRSSRSRQKVNYQFKEYDELIASAIQDDMIDIKFAEEFVPPEKDENSDDSEDGDDLYAGPKSFRTSKRKRKSRRLNDLDCSDIDDSGDDYKGLSTDTEHTPSAHTEVSMSGSNASGEWRIVKTKPKRKARRSKRGKFSSSEEEEQDSDGSSYRPTTRRAAQKKISYRELSSEDEWEELPKKNLAQKRKKKFSTSEDTSESSSFKESQSTKKLKQSKKWNESSSASESAESSASAESSSTRQSTGEWKIEKKSSEGGRIKININKKQVDSGSESSSKKSRIKKRINRLVSDDSGGDDDDEDGDDDDDDDDDKDEEDSDEEETEDEDSSESSAKSEQSQHSDSRKTEKVLALNIKKTSSDKLSANKVRPTASLKSNVVNTSSNKLKATSENKPKVTTKLPSNAAKDSPNGTKVSSDKSQSPGSQVRVSKLPNVVGIPKNVTVCRAVAINREQVSSSQIVVKTVVVKTVPKGAIKEIKMVPSKIPYKDKIDSNETENKKIAQSPKETLKPSVSNSPAPNSPNIKATPYKPPPTTKVVPVNLQSSPKNIPPKTSVISNAPSGKPFPNPALEQPRFGAIKQQSPKNIPQHQQFPPGMSDLQRCHPMQNTSGGTNIQSPLQRFPNPSMEHIRGSHPMQQAMPVRNIGPPMQRFPNPMMEAQMRPHPTISANHPMHPQMPINRPPHSGMPIGGPPRAYSSPVMEQQRPNTIQSSVPVKAIPPPQQPYSGSIVEPFSTADIDQGSDSRDEVPLERIPSASNSPPVELIPNKAMSYDKESEYRPAKETANFPYGMQEEKGFPPTYSPLSSLQEFTSRPSPLKPSLVETYPSNSASPTRLTSLDSYSQTNSPKGFISLDSYSQSRKKAGFSNSPSEGGMMSRPHGDHYQGEARFPQEPYPCQPSPGSYQQRSSTPQQRDPGTPPRLYSQFSDSYAPPRSPEFYQNQQQFYPMEEGMSRSGYQPNYTPSDNAPSYSYLPNAMQQPNDGFMIDTILRARNEEDELSNVSGIVQYITQQ